MSAPQTAVLGLSIDMASADPAYVQIFSQMREMILAGRLEPGERLPSTRAFAEELGVSRTTLVTAYDHLLSEGYIETRHGAGAFVAAYSPEQLLTATHGQTPPAPVAHKPTPRMPKAPVPFDAGVRDYETFPHAQWARLLQKHARNPPVDFMTEQDPAGEWALREAIADHLRVWRGLSCGAEQIFVTSGGVDAADLVLRCVAVPGGTAFLEDPGYGGTRRVVQEFGLEVDFRPVDDEGMMLPVERAAAPEGAVALVTPSRQFPLGLTKSLSRRLALIDWAARHKAWIMEDDYD
ncbi:MAG: PLP-dependent aminotransferase family protein, partial [Hyphomicrobiales bacterium]